MGNSAELLKQQAWSQVTSMILREHQLKLMSLTTTCSWMRLLGFQYDSYKKSFMLMDIMNART